MGADSTINFPRILAQMNHNNQIVISIHEEMEERKKKINELANERQEIMQRIEKERQETQKVKEYLQKIERKLDSQKECNCFFSKISSCSSQIYNYAYIIMWVVFAIFAVIIAIPTFLIYLTIKENFFNKTQGNNHVTITNPTKQLLLECNHSKSNHI